MQQQQRSAAQRSTHDRPSADQGWTLNAHTCMLINGMRSLRDGDTSIGCGCGNDRWGWWGSSNTQNARLWNMRTLSFARQWNKWVAHNTSPHLRYIEKAHAMTEERVFWGGCNKLKPWSICCPILSSLNLNDGPWRVSLHAVLQHRDSSPPDPANLDSYFHGRGRFRCRNACVLCVHYSFLAIVLSLVRDHWSGPLHNCFLALVNPLATKADTTARHNCRHPFLSNDAWLPACILLRMFWAPKLPKQTCCLYLCNTFSVTMMNQSVSMSFDTEQVFGIVSTRKSSRQKICWEPTNEVSPIPPCWIDDSAMEWPVD
jgi:hypothetical protein